jgi:hypothetical protein
VGRIVRIESSNIDEDIRAIMLKLMEIDATLEYILDRLLEEEDGEEEEEPDA